MDAPDSSSSRELAPNRAAGAFAGALQDAPLTPLHPNFVKVLRLRALLMALPPVIGASLAEIAGLPVPGMAILPVLLAAVLLVVRWPVRRFRARGYDMGADRLRVVKGTLFQSDTTVPFGRVQHLDVEQNPLERMYGLATLTVHTAGTHNASVSLPGLAYSTAAELREAIRAHVRGETM